MRHPKNTLMEDKMQKALTKTPTGLRAKKDLPTEVAARTTSLRRRFKPRHSEVQETAVAVLEPVEEPSPSPEEINAALESVNSFSEAPSPQIVQTAPSPITEPSPAQPEESSLSPATPYLVAYIGKLRDARNVLAYDLEQANKHLSKYRESLQSAQRDVDSAEMSVLTLTLNLEKIESNIFECHKLDDMSLEIATLLPNGSHTHKKATHEVEPKARMTYDDPRLCRKVDILAVFRSEPQRSWSAREVVDALPHIKQANGKHNVPSHLCVLNAEGTVTRVTKGVYTLAKAAETT